MGKFGRRTLAGMAAVLALTGCDWMAPQPQPTSASPTPIASATASTLPSGARSVREETDDFLFAYAYPAEAGNIPALAQLLDRRLERLRVQLVEQAAQGRADARGNGFPFNKYSSGVEWKVVADTPQFLSLSAEINSYTGGAHGNYGFDSLVWDKAGERVLQVPELFTSLAALEEVIGPRLCELLDAERARRRASVNDGEEAAPEPAPDDPFNACVPLSDTTLLLGSGNGRKFDRLGVQIGPYVAGPYAEGSWEFTLPVDAAVLGTVTAEYKPAFAARN